MLLHNHVLISLFHLFHLTYCEISNETIRLNFKYSDFQDVIFGSNIIFDNIASSKVDCAVTCSVNEECETFTYNRISKLCRGHNQKISTDDSYSNLSNTGNLHIFFSTLNSNSNTIEILFKQERST